MTEDRHVGCVQIAKGEQPDTTLPQLEAATRGLGLDWPRLAASSWRASWGFRAHRHW